MPYGTSDLVFLRVLQLGPEVLINSTFPFDSNSADACACDEMLAAYREPTTTARMLALKGEPFLRRMKGTAEKRLCTAYVSDDSWPSSRFQNPQCIPIFDEICRRSLKFLQSCLFHNTMLVRSVAQFSLTEGRNSSPCGRNALFLYASVPVCSE